MLIDHRPGSTQLLLCRRLDIVVINAGPECTCPSRVHSTLLLVCRQMGTPLFMHALRQSHDTALEMRMASVTALDTCSSLALSPRLHADNSVRRILHTTYALHMHLLACDWIASKGVRAKVVDVRRLQLCQLGQ